MKKFLFLLTITFYWSGFTQNINNYQYVIIPTKFSFQKTAMSYRINTTTKAYFNQKGFITFYDNEIPDDLNNQRCKALYVDIIENNNLLATKLTVNLVDCNKQIIMSSKQGVSREKDFETAYNESLRMALISMPITNYSYTKSKDEVTKINESIPVEIPKSNTNTKNLTLEKLSNGILIIDTKNNSILLKALKTSYQNVYIGISNQKNGVVYQKSDVYVFEYYENDVLKSETFDLR